MERFQRNAGTSGIIGAVLFLVGYILFPSTVLDPVTANDPAKALPIVAQLGSRWAITGIAFSLAVAFSVLFLAGFFSRVREKAPTRAAATLYFGLIGLSAFALDGTLQWLGGTHLVTYMAKDQVAASHAWVALRAAVQALEGLGNGFVGASIAIAGWAIIATSVFHAVLGWVGVVGGVLSFLQVFWPHQAVLFFASVILTIIWLAWAGSQLRSA